MRKQMAGMVIQNNSRKGRLNHDKYGYLFILPYFFGLFVFFAYPILYTFFLSLTNLRGFSNNYNIIGFQNYVKLINDEFFREAFLNTWKIWIPNFILQLGFALILAALFTDVRLKKIKAGGIFKIIFYMPNIITAASVAILFEAFFSYPNGPVNQLLAQFGVIKQSFEFFRSKTVTSLLVSFIQFWMWYGQTTIVLYAGMISISDSLYEAAEIDGASATQRFFKITLPLLRPIIIYVLITSLTGGLQLFDVPFLITDGIGSPDRSIMTMTMYLYKHGFTGINNYSYAATIAIGQFFAIILCSAVIWWLLRDRDKQNARRGAYR